ncbi:unknown [Acidaminococcus intestini CAG:325]|nr:unknown [Acidaminococcus intestini CAG:325]
MEGQQTIVDSLFQFVLLQLGFDREFAIVDGVGQISIDGARRFRPGHPVCQGTLFLPGIGHLVGLVDVNHTFVVRFVSPKKNDLELATFIVPEPLHKRQQKGLHLGVTPGIAHDVEVVRFDKVKILLIVCRGYGFTIGSPGHLHGRRNGQLASFLECYIVVVHQVRRSLYALLVHGFQNPVSGQIGINNLVSVRIGIILHPDRNVIASGPCIFSSAQSAGRFCTAPVQPVEIPGFQIEKQVTQAS